jgi:undecaprenyl diphosphate synthase
LKSNNENQIKHISFIMDGNGRWAKKRGLPRTAGHAEGVKKAKEVVLAVKDLGIPYVSMYTFSKENWKRSQDEVSFLMNLIVKHLEEEFDFYVRNEIAIRHIGDKEGLPDKVLKAIEKVEKDTINYKNNTVLLAINYSGKYDIIQAVNKVLEKKTENISEADFNKYLLTAKYPEPDLIIRTSGEFRISNFFLWQSAYSEYYITDKLWPDIQKKDIIEAIDNYNNRERRFGGYKNE